MTARKSTNWASVAPRTLTGPDACHSLKVAESLARGVHSLRPLSVLLGASRGLWRVISSLYSLGKNRSRAHGKHHKPEAMESITNCHRKKESQTDSRSEHHLARKSKGEELARESKPHKLVREGKGKELAREDKPHKLRDTVSITNCREQLALQTTEHGKRRKPHERVGIANCTGELGIFYGSRVGYI